VPTTQVGPPKGSHLIIVFVVMVPVLSFRPCGRFGKEK